MSNILLKTAIEQALSQKFNIGNDHITMSASEPIAASFGILVENKKIAELIVNQIFIEIPKEDTMIGRMGERAMIIWFLGLRYEYQLKIMTNAAQQVKKQQDL